MEMINKSFIGWIKRIPVNTLIVVFGAYATEVSQMVVLSFASPINGLTKILTIKDLCTLYHKHLYRKLKPYQLYAY